MWDMNTKLLTISITTWGGLRGRCGNSSDHFRQERIIVACIIRTKGKERFKGK